MIPQCGFIPPKFILLKLPNGAGNRILSVGDDPGCEHVYISVCARVVCVGTADAVRDNTYMYEKNKITNCRHVIRRLHTGICDFLNVRWVELTLFYTLF